VGQQRRGFTYFRHREGQGGVRNGADAGLITTDAARAVAGPGAAAANVYADDDSDQADALAEVLAEIDAVLARSSRLLAGENWRRAPPTTRMLTRQGRGQMRDGLAGRSRAADPRSRLGTRTSGWPTGSPLSTL
jgi:hypothetical protein